MKPEPETIYSTTIVPDRTNSVDVLAFLLVPESAFLDRDDGPDVRDATRRLLYEAKRRALLEWYASHVGRK